MPWLAEGFTPTWSEGLPASPSEVAPRVTTVPSTATNRAPAPAATRFRLASPFRPPRALRDGPAAEVRWMTWAGSSVGGWSGGNAVGVPPGGDWDSS